MAIPTACGSLSVPIGSARLSCFLEPIPQTAGIPANRCLSVTRSSPATRPTLANGKGDFPAVSHQPHARPIDFARRCQTAYRHFDQPGIGARRGIIQANGRQRLGRGFRLSERGAYCADKKQNIHGDRLPEGIYFLPAVMFKSSKRISPVAPSSPMLRNASRARRGTSTRRDSFCHGNVPRQGPRTVSPSGARFSS